MSGPDGDPLANDQLMREAAGWFARMRGPDAHASRDSFESWLGRGALHRRAYNRATEIFAMGKMLADDEGPSRVEARRQRLRTLVPMLAVLLMLLVAGGLALRFFIDGSQPREVRPGAPVTAELSSPPGGKRSVRLADGSVVDLGADSGIAIRFDSKVRWLVLKRGEALFRVAHEARPFVVDAAGGQVTARGTIFGVRLDAARHVTVRLFEGAVDVTLPASPAALARRTTRLHAGEALSYLAAGPSDRLSRSPAHAALVQQGPTPAAGATGSVQAREFDGVALNVLIAEANKGAGRPIRLADPTTGARRLSGRFRIDDTELLAERIAALLDLKVDRNGTTQIVLRTR